MEKTLDNETLWVEKYRPQIVNDCILPKEIKNIFQQIVNDGEMPNLLLAGGPGTGKTTSAYALCKQLGLDYIKINCSEDNGIETLRKKIRQFASSISLQSGTKVVILDEFDYANSSSFQPAMRGFMEEFSSNCRFILTCNYKNRIIEPLHSRCTVIEFHTSKKVLAELSGQFMKRLKFIYDNEGVKYEDRIVAELIMKFAPDWRRIINESQRYAKGGEISSDILLTLGDESLSELISHLKAKEFKKMRSWVTQNIDIDASAIFRKIYDGLYDFAEPKSIPPAILLIADYSYKHVFVMDKEINLVALLTELMVEVNWK